MYKNIAISLFFFLGSAMLSAQVNLLPIFSDNMVLQQQTQAPIWGKSKPDKKVEIITSPFFGFFSDLFNKFLIFHFDYCLLVNELLLSIS